jgi:hypothetical protein
VAVGVEEREGEGSPARERRVETMVVVVYGGGDGGGDFIGCGGCVVGEGWYSMSVRRKNKPVRVRMFDLCICFAIVAD